MRRPTALPHGVPRRTCCCPLYSTEPTASLPSSASASLPSLATQPTSHQRNITQPDTPRNIDSSLHLISNSEWKEFEKKIINLLCSDITTHPGADCQCIGQICTIKFSVRPLSLYSWWTLWPLTCWHISRTLGKHYQYTSSMLLGRAGGHMGERWRGSAHSFTRLLGHRLWRAGISTRPLCHPAARPRRHRRHLLRPLRCRLWRTFCSCHRGGRIRRRAFLTAESTVQRQAAQTVAFNVIHVW